MRMLMERGDRATSKILAGYRRFIDEVDRGGFKLRALPKRIDVRR